MLYSLGGGALACFASPGFAAAREPCLEGTWSGFVDSDDPPTRLRLKVDRDGNGSLTVISTVDETPVPLAKLDAFGRHLRLAVAGPPIRYEAQLDADGALRGTLTRGDS